VPQEWFCHERNTKSKAGTLYLVPAPLDFGCESQTALTEVLPEGTLRRAASLTHWISENAKTARAYLKRIDALFPLAAPLQAQNIAELPREAHKKATMATRAAPSSTPSPCWHRRWPGRTWA
jgi:16S rRNA (cytidine1402-2'-O)-methyltransferase